MGRTGSSYCLVSTVQAINFFFKVLYLRFHGLYLLLCPQRINPIHCEPNSLGYLQRVLVLQAGKLSQMDGACRATIYQQVFPVPR